jgi:hypothetical protein
MPRQRASLQLPRAPRQPSPESAATPGSASEQPAAEVSSPARCREGEVLDAVMQKLEKLEARAGMGTLGRDGSLVAARLEAVGAPRARNATAPPPPRCPLDSLAPERER